MSRDAKRVIGRRRPSDQPAERSSRGMIRATLHPMDTSAPSPSIARVRAVARVLDTAIGIPGTKIRFGLDPIIGLVPGLGDVASAVLSGYIVLTGIRLGVSPTVVARMIGNIAIDTLLGSVPVLGDLFDASWKSNKKNVELLERHLGVATTGGRRNRLLALGGVVALTLIAAAGAALAFVAIRFLISAARR